MTLSLSRTQSSADLSRRGDVLSAGWTLQMSDGSLLMLIRSKGGWRALPLGSLDVPGLSQVGSGVQMNHTQAWKCWQTLGCHAYPRRKDLQEELEGIMIAHGFVC